MKIKGTVKAWQTSKYSDFDAICNRAKNDADEAISMIAYSNSDMSIHSGWVEIGVATITVEFFHREAIVAKQVEGLREQLRQHRINAEQAEQAILSQISKLTAIAA